MNISIPIELKIELRIDQTSFFDQIWGGHKICGESPDSPRKVRRDEQVREGEYTLGKNECLKVFRVTQKKGKKFIICGIISKNFFPP